MSGTDVLALLPLLVLTGTIVVVLLAISVRRSHAVAVVLSLSGLALAFVALFVAAPHVPRPVTDLVTVDGYALFYTGLVVVAAFAVTALSYNYLRDRRRPREEYYVLLLMATLGGAILVVSNHFASFFLGLEILSVSLYALIAYLADRKISIEAGIKYLVLAAVSSAFLLFGMALVYADQGTMVFDQLLMPEMTPGAGIYGALFPVGLGLIAVGLGLKLALVPFHLWTPDVYEGAPAPVTGYIATASKGAVFGLLLRLFAQVNVTTTQSLILIFSAIAVASMLIGNLLALRQNNLKRLLAYSSIAHLGYLLIALLAGGSRGFTAAAFYLAAYFVSTLAAFGAIGALSGPEQDLDMIDDYRGLFWKRPGLSMILAAALFSLAGIPLTAGFLAKLTLLWAGIGTNQWVLAITLVVGSAIGIYYYLRVIVAMYRAPEPEGKTATARLPGTALPALPLAGGVVLAVLTLLVLWLGIYPTPLLNLLEAVLAPLV